jgi:hypothetical protein
LAEAGISGHEHKLVVIDSFSGGEVECVISAKSVQLGYRPSTANESVSDLDKVELTIEIQQIGHRSP